MSVVRREHPVVRSAEGTGQLQSKAERLAQRAAGPTQTEDNDAATALPALPTHAEASTVTADATTADATTGTEEAPAQRKFRPDVEGLRAIAVLLVVLYHAHVPGVRGGFVGVDIFFVISGFLITGLLVREHERRSTISILRFYARRARRILPASTVVVIFTVFAVYHWLGFVEGNSVADTAKWTAVFLANIHLAQIGTSYFGSQAPPSALQHMWSLGVEEQFYVVWPGLFLLVAALGRRLNVRVKLGILLVVIVAASLTWSILQTGDNSTWAYFSPLTRAWELGVGALVAIVAPWIGKVPRQAALWMGLAGLGGLLASGFWFTASTPYPGSAAALPVFGTALFIAAGTAATKLPGERLLATRPFQWFGARSYSLYLWHWPILIIATEYAFKPLPLWQNLMWVLVAIVAAALSYRFIENPVRRSTYLSKRPLVSVAMGIALILITIGIAQWQISAH
jgi:peptidoglycan/LPS O-acetylase OafA/YrhL